jgi:hypothetical protein
LVKTRQKLEVDGNRVLLVPKVFSLNNKEERLRHDREDLFYTVCGISTEELVEIGVVVHIMV